MLLERNANLAQSAVIHFSASVKARRPESSVVKPEQTPVMPAPSPMAKRFSKSVSIQRDLKADGIKLDFYPVQ